MFALSQRGSWVMKAAEKKVSLYDTTLRDGTQGEGFQLSGLDKLRIAHRLDEFGVDYIEGGWPGSNPKDVEFFKAAAEEEWIHARIAAFGSTRRHDRAVEDDAQILVELLQQGLLALACDQSFLFGKLRVNLASTSAPSTSDSFT